MLYINTSVACLKFATKRSFSDFQPILAAIFVTRATLKVESYFYTLAKKLVKNNFYFLTTHPFDWFTLFQENPFSYYKYTILNLIVTFFRRIHLIYPEDLYAIDDDV